MLMISESLLSFSFISVVCMAFQTLEVMIHSTNSLEVAFVLGLGCHEIILVNKTYHLFLDVK